MVTPRRRVFVQPQAPQLETPQVTAADVGVPSGELEQVTRGISQDVRTFAQKQLQEADDLAIQTLQNRSDRKKLDIESRVQETKGRNSFGIETEATQEYEDFMAELESEALTSRQKTALGTIRSRSSSQISRSSRGHELSQIDKVKSQEFAAGSKNIIESGLMHWQDPERSFENIEEMSNLITKEAERQGLGKEAREAFFKDRMSAYHQSVFNKILLEKDKDTAKAYLEIADDDLGHLTGSSLDEMKAALKEADFRGEAQTVTDNIMRSSSVWDDRFNAARNIDDPEKRDEVTRRLKAEFQLEKSLRAEAQNQTFLNGTNEIESNPGKQIRDLIHEDDWNKLSLGQRQALQRHSDFLDPNKKPKMDWDSLFKFYDLTPNQRANLSEMDFRVKYWSKMDNSNRNKIFNLWQKDRKADVKGILSVEDHMKNELRELNWIPPTGGFKDDDNALRYQRFTTSFDEWLKSFRAKEDSDPTQEVIVKKVRELTSKTFNGPEDNGGFSVFKFSRQELKERFNQKELRVSLSESRGGLTRKQFDDISKRLQSSQIIDPKSSAFRDKIRRIGAAMRLGDDEKVERIISGREN